MRDVAPKVTNVLGYLDHLVDAGHCDLSILAGQQLSHPYELWGKSGAIYMQRDTEKAIGSITAVHSAFEASIPPSSERLFWNEATEINFETPITVDLFKTRLVRNIYNNAIVGILVAGIAKESLGFMVPAANYKTGFFELNPDRASDPTQHVLRYRDATTRPPRPKPIPTFTTASFA